MAKAALVLSFAALALVITFVVINSRSGVDAGTVVEVQSPVEGAETSFALPDGNLEMKVTTPLSNLPDDYSPADPEQNDEPDTVRSGGRWVGVSWQLFSTPASSFQGLIGLDQSRWFSVAIVADGRRYELPTDDPSLTENGYSSTQESMFVALAGNPRDIVIEVTYDGVTQAYDTVSTLLDQGDASGLTDAPWLFDDNTCDELRIDAPGFDIYEDEDLVTCTFDVHSTSYLEGRGWADPGKTWLIVSIFTDADAPFVYWPVFGDPDSSSYLLKLESTSVTLDGTAPLVTIPTDFESRPNRFASRYVFDVPATGGGVFTFDQTYVDEGDDIAADAPDRAVGTAAFTATLESPE